MKFSRKMSLLVTHKSLSLFVNTLTADDKYSLLNKDNLAQPIQMQLSTKLKKTISKQIIKKKKKKKCYFSPFDCIFGI